MYFFIILNKIRVHESFTYLFSWQCDKTSDHYIFDMADSARVQEAVARLLGAVAKMPEF